MIVTLYIWHIAVLRLDKPNIFLAPICFWKSRHHSPDSWWPRFSRKVCHLWDILASHVGKLARKTMSTFTAAWLRQLRLPCTVPSSVFTSPIATTWTVTWLTHGKRPVWSTSIPQVHLHFLWNKHTFLLFHWVFWSNSVTRVLTWGQTGKNNRLSLASIIKMWHTCMSHHQQVFALFREFHNEKQYFITAENFTPVSF